MNSWEELSKRMNEYVSPYVCHYMSNKYDRKRKCNPKSPIYKGVVINKTIPAAYFKQLIFPEDDKNEVNI